MTTDQHITGSTSVAVGQSKNEWFTHLISYFVRFVFCLNHCNYFLIQFFFFFEETLPTLRKTILHAVFPTKLNITTTKNNKNTNININITYTVEVKLVSDE